MRALAAVAVSIALATAALPACSEARAQSMGGGSMHGGSMHSLGGSMGPAGAHEGGCPAIPVAYADYDIARETPQSDNTDLCTWTDWGSNGVDLTQGTAANCPHYRTAANCVGDKPCADFTGAMWLTETAATWGTVSNPLTVCVVYTRDDASTGTLHDTVIDTDNASNRIIISHASGNAAINADGTLRQTAFAPVANTVYAECAQVNGSTTEVSIGGSTFSIAGGTNSMGGIVIGADRTQNVNWDLEGEIYRVTVFEGSQDLATLEAHYNCEYNPALSAQRVFPRQWDYVFDGADVDGDKTFDGYSYGTAITTWTGQAGGTAAPIAADNDRAPRYCETCCNGLGGLQFDGVNNQMTFASSSTGLSFVSDSCDFELFAVYHRDRAGRAGSGLTTFIGNSNGPPDSGWSFNHDRLTPRFRISNGTINNVNGNPDAAFDATIGEITFANWRCSGVGTNTLDYTGDFGDTTAQQSPTGTLPTSPMTDDIHIGYYEDSQIHGDDVTLCFLGIVNGEESSAHMASVYDWAQRRYGASGAFAPSRVVSVIGDSLSAPNSAWTSYGWATKVQNDLNASTYSWAVGNNARSGWDIDECATEYANNVDPFAGSDGVVDTLVLWCGTNSIASGATASATFATWEGIVDDALGEGMTVIVGTAAPRGGDASWDAGKQAELVSLNASIRAKGGVTVIDAYDLFGDSGDATIIDEATYGVGDGIHVNDAGHALLASEYGDALEAS